jgi:hypothetical protein
MAVADMHKEGIREDGTVERPGLSVETHYRPATGWRVPGHGEWVEIQIDADGIDYATRCSAESVLEMAAAIGRAKMDGAACWQRPGRVRSKHD